MMCRVLVLYTGGTLGMARSADGFRPAAGFGGVLRRALGDLAPGAWPAVEVAEIPDPIDSADLLPGHWRTIAEALVARWDRYDGFVVVHGTDTMAWTASALSFMLAGCDKPVILTGAQIPLLEPRSDAMPNLQAALLLAARAEIREVGICFGRRLLRGNRCTKTSTSGLDAFDSPNCAALADVGIDVVVHAERLWRADTRSFVVPRFDPGAVAVLTLHPGISAPAVRAVADHPAVRGLVLRSYGAGNLPSADSSLLKALAEAAARGVVVLNTTQCATGAVAQHTYATGAALARIGAVAGADLTLEAAFAKLHVLLATEADRENIHRKLGRSLCGELS